MRCSPSFPGILLAGALLADGPPSAVKKPVVDEYHGIEVTDDYRWLETWSDPAVRQWSDAQNRYARQYLDSLPMRPALYSELERLYKDRSWRYRDLKYRGGHLFGMVDIPQKEQPVLAELSPGQPAPLHIIVDPAQIDPQGHSAIDFYAPSLDGKRVAVSISQGGSESGDLHIYETATGKALADVIPRVNGGTAGGSVAWNADGSGFYYTRYPHAGERPEADLGFYQQVWFHKLGADSSQDQYSLGKDFPRIAEIALETSSDGHYVLAQMAYGDGGQFAHYLLGPDQHWRQIARLADQISAAAFGGDGFLYLLSHANAPRGKVLKVPLERPQLTSAETVVPEGTAVIEQVVAGGKHLYVSELMGGPSQIRVFDTSGRSLGAVPLSPVSSVFGMLHYQGDELLFQNVSYTQPAAWFRFNPNSREMRRTSLAETAPADFSDTEVIRETAVSADGAKVPLTIIQRKGTKLDGQNPVLLYGYGGYNISLKPQFDVSLRPLLDRGVIYTVANLRGGGEFGEAWHEAGMLTKKQNVFDDFAACARHLVQRRYTASTRLAIEGGSNGGLLMGAELTQHPDLFAAVVSHVGIYDMLRVELSPNGAFNVTEFGTVKELDQFRALYAYSPYHHVKDGVHYPPVLFLTGANDPRVDPMHSRKMTARLQAAGTTQPVLLRTSGTSGHGIGTALSERIAQRADVLAFLFAQWARNGTPQPSGHP
ncbi:MAG: S9 family peptidase [Acidobacteriia bacterium]|nr:S9 family peptidase [Terriglobia bacterium]MBV8904915.1 S9 family peptidase [Terriglobia bacterium]